MSHCSGVRGCVTTTPPPAFDNCSAGLTDVWVGHPDRAPRDRPAPAPWCLRPWLGTVDGLELEVSPLTPGWLLVEPSMGTLNWSTYKWPSSTVGPWWGDWTSDVTAQTPGQDSQGATRKLPGLSAASEATESPPLQSEKVQARSKTVPVSFQPPLRIQKAGKSVNSSPATGKAQVNGNFITFPERIRVEITGNQLARNLKMGRSLREGTRPEPLAHWGRRQAPCSWEKFS